MFFRQGKSTEGGEGFGFSPPHSSDGILAGIQIFYSGLRPVRAKEGTGEKKLPSQVENAGCIYSIYNEPAMYGKQVLCVLGMYIKC